MGDYDESMNFNNRLKVETNMGSEGVIDHREGFSQREYNRGLNGVYEPPEGAGLPTVKRGERKKIKPSTPAKGRAKPRSQKKQTDADSKLEAAVKNDLKNRGL